jgi:DNA polymerase kappa
MDSAEENGDAPDANTELGPQSSQEHKTLKYSLLGPSLLKAGQDAVDQRQVSDTQSFSSTSTIINHIIFFF